MAATRFRSTRLVLHLEHVSGLEPSLSVTRRFHRVVPSPRRGRIPAPRDHGNRTGGSDPAPAQPRPWLVPQYPRRRAYRNDGLGRQAWLNCQNRWLQTDPTRT
jgi:hypothetical protein